MPRKTTVSFIVLSYNYERFVGQTIESILSQDFEDIEIIVSDDGSTDGSVEVIRKFGDPRLQLIESQDNRGACRSFVDAFNATSGDFICVVDADDYIEKQRTSRQLEVFRQDPDLGVVATLVQVVSDGSGRAGVDDFAEACASISDLNDIRSWIVVNPVCHSSAMVRREAYERDGLVDMDMHRATDYEKWLRFLRAGWRFKVIPERLTHYRAHAGGVTHANARETLFEISFLLAKHAAPIIHRDEPRLMRKIASWVTCHSEWGDLAQARQERLLGSVLRAACHGDYRDFSSFVLHGESGSIEQEFGRTAIALVSGYSHDDAEWEKAQSDISAYIEARDWWKTQADTAAAMLEHK